MRTGWVWHEWYMWHDTGHGAAYAAPGRWVEPDTYAENPETKRRLRNLLEVSGLLAQLVPIAPRPARDDELLRLHTPAYLERVRALAAAGGGDAGENTPFGRESFAIAALAAGGAICAVDAVLDGEVDTCYAMVRPPGHHAEADRGRGFCIFGNVALAALHARIARGLDRVAIVDWDVHHGNGTQAAFYENPSVLTISLHQDGAYPNDSGAMGERGAGAGNGYNVNVPLPPGSGTGAYVETMRRVVVPALTGFRPQLILIACGFDASALDPLGRQLLHSGSFRTLTQLVLDAAGELCDGRLVLCHEGGYSTAYVPFCGVATIETLAGVRTEVEDPFLAPLSGAAGHELQPHQDEVISLAAALRVGADG